VVARWSAKLAKVLLWLYIVAEVGTFIFLTVLHFRMWEPMYDLTKIEPAPHSIYSMQSMDVPYYTWSHRRDYGEGRNRTKILTYKKDPVYARKKLSVPL